MYPVLSSECGLPMAEGVVLHSSGSGERCVRVNLTAEGDGQQVEETAMDLVEPLLSQHIQPAGEGVEQEPSHVEVEIHEAR